MNIYITLDYELFLGKQSGTVDNCIIKPANKLLKIVDRYNIKISFFVDAGYLMALERQKDKFSNLEEDYQKISQQIKSLSKEGHGVELHIHPHWEDTFFKANKGWVSNTSRYKLTDYSEEEILDIVTRYNNILKKHTITAPVAFRAGGWSAQPFNKIKKALEKNNILIDSTAYPNGYYQSANQKFDFRKVPQYKTQYKFLDDFVTEEINGNFTEIPISSYKVSPLFFWKFALKKVFKQKKHIAFGDGNAISKDKDSVLKLLTKSSYSVVSVDGYKALYLIKAFKIYIKNTTPDDNFVIIGHPKAFTPYSLKKIKVFIEKNYKNHSYVIFKK